MSIIDQLVSKIKEKQCPVVVGLDPLIRYVPDELKRQVLSEFGNTEKAAAEALFRFNAGLIEWIHPLVPAVKLQMACYELYGSFGLDVFSRTVKLAKDHDLVVIDDSKRNDIGSTASVYASGHLGSAELIEGVSDPARADFLTINPYLGSDSIRPFVETCQRFDKGLFILVRTSNPSSAEYQEALSEGRPLFVRVAEDTQKIAKTQIGESGFSAIGAVVGATWPQEARHLREIMPSSYFLVPGYGAQGAGAEQVVEAFNEDGFGALINSSRGIMLAYRNPAYQKDFPLESQFAQAARSAVLNMRDDLLRALDQVGKMPSGWSP